MSPVAQVDLPRSALPEPAERGALSVAHTVVRKVAQHAADLVPGTVPNERRIAGVSTRKSGATAKVAGSDNDVDLALELALRYPAAVQAVTGDVRAKVVEEVERLTSYHVRSLAVTVSALLPDVAPRVQ